MRTTYTAETLHALLRALLAPAFTRRRTADQMLFQLHCGTGSEPNPQLDSLLQQATQRFGAQRQEFLQALIGWWLNASADSHAALMASFGSMRKFTEPGWQPVPPAPDYPLREAGKFRPYDMYGMGVQHYLQRQAAELGFAVPLLLRGLQHPNGSTSDACFALLGGIGADAAGAFPAMLQMACERGPYFGPDQPMRSLAALVDACPPLADVLAAALEAPPGAETMAAISAVSHHLRTVPPALFAALLQAFARVQDSGQRYSLFCALVEIAQRSPCAEAADLLHQAQQLAASDDEVLRSAAAWGLVRLGTPAAQEAQLLQLLRDPVWTPRSNACAALQHWPDPSPALVLSVAAQLMGDEQDHDNYLHENARATLIHWGERSAVALERIQVWLDRTIAMGEVRAESLLELVQALGEPGRSLLPQVEAFLRDQPDEDDEDGEWAHEAGDAAQAGESDAAEEPDADARAGESDEDAGDAAAALLPEWLGESDDLSIMLQAAGYAGLSGMDGNDDVELPDPQEVPQLAQQLGIDLHEDIPGTPSSRELREQPDSVALLRRWVAGA